VRDIEGACFVLEPASRASRGGVSTNLGFSAESPNTSRIALMAVFSLWPMTMKGRSEAPLELIPNHHFPGTRFSANPPGSPFDWRSFTALDELFYQIKGDFFRGNKGALSVPFLSFQILRRPGRAAKLLCFHQVNSFDPDRPFAILVTDKDLRLE
jgi:hypothetical protein